MDNIYIIPCMEKNRLKSIESIGSLVDRVLEDII